MAYISTILAETVATERTFSRHLLQRSSQTLRECNLKEAEDV